jgi:hypothetical protein
MIPPTELALHSFLRHRVEKLAPSADFFRFLLPSGSMEDQQQLQICRPSASASPPYGIAQNLFRTPFAEFAESTTLAIAILRVLADRDSCLG